jgi:septum formation protein
MAKEIILASASKRRSEILASCGIRHKVFISNAREVHLQNRTPAWNVTENARRKACICAKIHKNNIIIAVDTLVVLDKRLIGKPKSEMQAKRLFRAFNGGQRLEIISGLCVMETPAARIACAAERSFLRARRLDSRDLDRYFKALRPYDKAGGFSIEGIGSFIYDDIKGSYFNILGLPMARLKGLFDNIGLDILDFCR